MRMLELFKNAPHGNRIGAILAFILLITGLPAQAEQLKQHISMNAPYSGVPFRILPTAPVTLHNDGESTLHQTTISRIASGSRLARIITVQAGQSLNVEFSQEGMYSICFFLTAETLPGQERCLYLDVVPLRITGLTGTGPLHPGPLS